MLARKIHKTKIVERLATPDEMFGYQGIPADFEGSILMVSQDSDMIGILQLLVDTYRETYLLSTCPSSCPPELNLMRKLHY